MKKIITLLAVFGIVSFQSCTVTDNAPIEDNDTISEVFEVTNVSFTGANEYGTFVDLNPKIYSGDVILIYRLEGIVNGNKVWNIIPETHYYNDGTLFFSYRFNFTQYDVNIYLDGFELNTIPNNLRLNQTFRIVIVPGDDGINSKTSNKIDYSNYNDVIKRYNINDSNVKKLN